MKKVNQFLRDDGWKLVIMVCSLFMSLSIGLIHIKTIEPSLWAIGIVFSVLPTFYVSVLLTGTIKQSQDTARRLQVIEESLQIAEATLKGENRGKRQNISAMLRKTVMDRDQCRCVYCGRTGSEGIDPEGNAWNIDHVVAVSRGGPTRADNLVLACQRCNLRKRDKPVYLFVQELIRKERKSA